MSETLQFTIEGADGTDEIELPAELIDRLGEPGQPPSEVVADVAVMSFAGRAHALVHHAEGEADADLEAAEESMLDRFEERFGMTYGEATGHSH